jgi:hypothetical protein
MHVLGITALIAAAAPGHPFLEAADQPPNLDVQPAPPPKSQTIVVLILSGEEAGIPLSEVYGNARKAIEENTALVVAPLDVISLNNREAAIRDCAGKAACFAAKVRGTAEVQVELLLTVSVDRLDEGTLVGFRLVDVGSEQEIGAAGDEVPVGMSMLGAMERQLPDVFPKSVWGQIANLSVVTQPEGAEVTVAGRSCVSPCDLKRILPGTYAISIKKTDFEPWSGTVALAARETAKVEQTLAEPPGGITSNPFFWGGIAAVVVGLGVGAFFLFRPNDRIVNICIADDPMQCENN